MGEGQRILAVQRQNSGTCLLACDSMGSPLHADGAPCITHSSYMAFGYSPSHASLPVGFHGDYPHWLHGWYAKGNGYRWYLPQLMRFSAPDSLSPFSVGGINSYAYAGNDPVNRSDPSGHYSTLPINGVSSRKYTQLQRIVSYPTNGKGIYESTARRGKPELFLDLHGNENIVEVDDRQMGSRQLVKWLGEQKIEVKRYGKIHLWSCDSGALPSKAEKPLAQSFANLTGVTTEAFDGIVRIKVNPSPSKQGLYDLHHALEPAHISEIRSITTVGLKVGYVPIVFKPTLKSRIRGFISTVFR